MKFIEKVWIWGLIPRGTIVPIWFQKISTVSGIRFPRWSAQLELFLFLLVANALCLKFLPNWTSFITDEGFVYESAKRVASGSAPHRDFFFLWTPGTAVLHGFLSNLQLSWYWQRALGLSAWLIAVGALLVWNYQRSGRVTARLEALLVLCFGFHLWNLPYSSWYAIALCLLPLVGKKNHYWFTVPMSVGMAFWFKQNVGVGAAAFYYFLWGLELWCGSSRKESSGRLFLFSFGIFLLAILLPLVPLVLNFGSSFIAPFLNQVFLFPFRYTVSMGLFPTRELLGASLLALFLFADARGWVDPKKTSLRVALRAIGIGLFSLMLSWFVVSPKQDTAMRLFVLLALGMALYSLARLTIEARLSQDTSLWVVIAVLGAGLFQAFPRFDMQHVLFFSPVLFAVLFQDKQLVKENSFLRLFVLLLTATGLFLAVGTLNHLYRGRWDPYGRLSTNIPFEFNQELQRVGLNLESNFPREEKLLVIPSATYANMLLGRSNPLPHLQFFPQYVESYGATQVSVLCEYAKMGGRFILLQRNSGFAEFTPQLLKVFLSKAKLVHSFPIHFDLWELTSGSAACDSLHSPGNLGSI